MSNAISTLMTGLSRITGIRSNLCFNKKILFVENEDKFEKEEGEILEHSAHTMNLPPANVGSEIGQQEKTVHDLEEGQSLESRQSTTRGKLDNRKSFTIQRLESDSAKKKFEDSESYFFNNGMGIAIGTLFFAMNVVVGAHAAFQFTERGGFTTDSYILRITLPIARAGGRLVTFNCAWLLITACKYLWTMIRSHVVPILPVGFPIDDIMPKYHRIVALWIIFCGCIVHALPQILNYATGAIKIDDGKKVWTFGDGMATRQLLITGTALTVVFATFFLTTFKSFRKTTAGFRWFWFFHMGGIALSYPLLIVHGTFRGQPVFLFCALAPLLLYAFDLTKRNSKTKKTRILEWKAHRKNGREITELVVECPPNFVYTPGQYVELKYNPISTEEWHPFTIASAPNNDIRIYDRKRVRVLIFFIQSVGRWTGSMFHSALKFDLKKARRREIFIKGPYGSPASNFFEYKHIIVIGSGVGVTPLLSVWQYMMNRGSSKNRYDDLLMGSISKRLLRVSSGSKLDEEDSCSTSSETVVEGNENIGNFRLACSKTQDVLESLTVSMFLFCLFLALETIIVVTVIFGHYGTVAWLESVVAPISLIIHVGTIVASACAVGDFRYYLQFKCWIEVAVTVVDAFNLWLSISFLQEQHDTEEATARWARLILALGATSVFLHAIRIFHIFYTTLKPQVKSVEMTQQSMSKSKVSSIKGIFINPKYEGMNFCFDQLLQPVDDDLSPVVKMELFGTREKRSGIRPSLLGSSEVAKSMRNVTSSESQCYSFYNGRPDFESMFQKEVQSVKRSNPAEDEISIGVFFCGSPAIAKSIRSAADKVNAYHQRLATRAAASSSSENHCTCKIVVHVENF